MPELTSTRILRMLHNKIRKSSKFKSLKDCWQLARFYKRGRRIQCRIYFLICILPFRWSLRLEWFRWRRKQGSLGEHQNARIFSNWLEKLDFFE
jgi:hypothetical protein